MSIFVENLTENVYLLRHYKVGNYYNRDKYSFVCTIIADGRTAIIKGAHGLLDRDAYKMITKHLVEMQFDKMLMERHGHWKETILTKNMSNAG